MGSQVAMGEPYLGLLSCCGDQGDTQEAVGELQEVVWVLCGVATSCGCHKKSQVDRQIRRGS